MKQFGMVLSVSLFVWLGVFEANAEALPFCSNKWVPYACKCRKGVWQTTKKFHKTSRVRFGIITLRSVRASAVKSLKRQCKKRGRILKWSHRSLGAMKQYKLKGVFHFVFTLRARCTWEKTLQYKKKSGASGKTVIKFATGVTKKRGLQKGTKPIKPSFRNKLCQKLQKKVTRKLKRKYKKNYVSHSHTGSCGCYKGAQVDIRGTTKQRVICKRAWRVKYKFQYKPGLYRCIP